MSLFRTFHTLTILSTDPPSPWGLRLVQEHSEQDGMYLIIEGEMRPPALFLSPHNDQLADIFKIKERESERASTLFGAILKLIRG